MEMDSSIVELIILAVVAVFVLSRLYSVLGKKTGAPPKTISEQTRTEEPVRPAEKVTPISAEMGEAVGLEEILQADPDFSPRAFLKGARSAYEMIVNAFAAGDKKSLKPLLSDEVYEDYCDAISARKDSGSGGFELLRLKQSYLVGGRVEDKMAEIEVHFEAELGDGERARTSKEVWTFERELRSNDPNWRLSDVSVVS